MALRDSEILVTECAANTNDSSFPSRFCFCRLEMNRLEMNRLEMNRLEMNRLRSDADFFG